MEHEIKQRESASRGVFLIEENGQQLAEMTYSKAGDKLVIIDHTQVDDSLRGTGTGKALVEKAVEWARENHLKIMPLCPFANSVFQRNPDWQDVLSK